MESPFDLFRLDGRVALITGGSGGLGQVFAHALASAGADIAILGRRVEAAQAVVDEVHQRTERNALAASTRET